MYLQLDKVIEETIDEIIEALITDDQTIKLKSKVEEKKLIIVNIFYYRWINVIV